MRRSATLALALGLTALSAPAMAHTGHGAGGFEAGLAHPLFGLDHLLAMVSVGVLGVTLGGRALWALPGAFLAMMVVGGMLGMAGITLPLVETGIAVSVVALGLALATRIRIPALLATVFVGAFAVFHGHAHGAEAPVAASGLTYAAGFVAATAVLHVLGIAAASVAERRGVQLVTRAGGAAIAAFGLFNLVG